MEWFVIYIFVMVERLAALLALGWAAFWFGLLLLGLTLMVCALQTDSGSFGSTKVTFTDNIESRWGRFTVKVGKWSMVIGLFLGICTYLIPSQKDLAIIVGSGVTYKAVTSETGQRIGGKAIDYLEKKLDDALGDEQAPSKPEQAPTPAKPEAKGQAL